MTCNLRHPMGLRHPVPLARFECFLFFLLLLPWIASIFALFLRSPSLPWKQAFRSLSLLWKPAVQPHRWHSLAHPPLLASFSSWSLGALSRVVRVQKRMQTSSTWHEHAGRFKDDPETQTMPKKRGWIQVLLSQPTISSTHPLCPHLKQGSPLT